MEKNDSLQEEGDQSRSGVMLLKWVSGSAAGWTHMGPGAGAETAPEPPGHRSILQKKNTNSV